MIYLLLVILSIVIAFTVIIGMLLISKRNKNVNLELSVIGLKANMEVAEEKPRV